MANKARANLRYKKGYGENFKKLRKSLLIGDKPCTVRQLADKLSISYSTISKIESEEREPTIEQLQIYHDFFDVPLDYLLGRSNTIKEENAQIGKELRLSDKAVENLKNEVLKREELKKSISDILENVRIITAMVDYINTVEGYYYFYAFDEESKKELTRIGDKTHSHLDEDTSCESFATTDKLLKEYYISIIREELEKIRNNK